MDQLSKNKILILIILVFIAALIGVVTLTTQNIYQPKKSTLKINDTLINVELAETIEKQVRGLSGLEKIDPNYGMLFYFSDYKMRNFWMDGMLFPIDIIWIVDDKIIAIDKNIPIPTKEPLKMYPSPSPVNLVLEVAAGFTDKNNIRVGDKVEFSLLPNGANTPHFTF